MSLDIDLIDADDDAVYSTNITHNLGEMAERAGLYGTLWNPIAKGFTKAEELIPSLEEGVAMLAQRKRYFEQFNAGNGWGTYKDFLLFCVELLQACRDYPDARIEVSK